MLKENAEKVKEILEDIESAEIFLERIQNTTKFTQLNIFCADSDKGYTSFIATEYIPFEEVKTLITQRITTVITNLEEQLKPL